MPPGGGDGDGEEEGGIYGKAKISRSAKYPELCADVRNRATCPFYSTEDVPKPALLP